jgi:uncharacterized membrane protein
MKRFLGFTLIVIFVSGLLFGRGAVLAQEALPLSIQDSIENIQNFEADISISKNGLLSVVETITYNFGPEQKHGIFRYVPKVYKDSTRGINTAYKLRLKVTGVTDENGQAYKYEVSTKNNSLYIKIGDANSYVTGVKTYRIAYTAERAISFFEDHDELYWNVLGNDWNVPVGKVTARVSLPEKTDLSKVNTTCYTGPAGYTEKNCVSENEDSGSAKTILFSSTKRFLPLEGLTIVVGFPKGIVAMPAKATRFWWFVIDNWMLAVPPISFVVMFLLWRRYGQDMKGKGVVVAEYEPPQKLSPLEVGGVVKQKVVYGDFPSLIIDLAVRGFVKIKYIDKSYPKDYELVKLKDASALMSEDEKNLFEALFKTGDSVKLSSLKDFYKNIYDLIDKVYVTLTTKGYFEKNPWKVRRKYYIAGILMGFLGMVFLPIVGDDLSFITLGSFFLSGFIIILFGKFMPRFSKLGIETRDKIKGFKLFLSVTEKDRLAFHNAPEKKPELFERYLPYAMVLGVEKEWAKQFESLNLRQPSWYEGNGTAFNAAVFAGNMRNFSLATSSALSSSPSGGSGFSGGSSGGGFGGGGGGSW